ncbi:DinB superfamily [Longilinea arvoryzae]|uniref:DinB superfamily n=1 Tax=Longilinea arvoryzae TaxID=360412 RepID=A0A0S7BBK3_9CHLR|nr:ClbS/DfsB family four-helix bundle protein [Longilinea arvoryzae]GAP12621.1 DinB superfamily [Longilinea arvoryzae]
MNMKHHILAALREVFGQWEDLLDSLSEAQITAPLAPSEWSVKDVIAHLWIWQQRSLARSEAARLDREPVYPDWPVAGDPDGEGGADPVNDWIHATYQDASWASLRQEWRAGFIRLLNSAKQIPERDLLDGSRHAWLNGYSMADVLIGSYDHHKEHLDGLREWLREHRQEL